MKNCSMCGKYVGIGTYSLISDKCDDCYEKITYYTPDHEYVKEYIKREFVFPIAERSAFDLVVFFSECQTKVFDEIGEKCEKSEKHFVTVFDEFDMSEKLKELFTTNHIKLEYSFFFGDTKFDTIACFEDRKKRRSVLIR